MKQSNELNKIDSTPKIDWKKVSLEKLRKSLDKDIEERIKYPQTNADFQLTGEIHEFI